MLILTNNCHYFLQNRVGPIEIDVNEIERLHNQLVPDLENSDDSASDEEEDAINWEWEAVSTIHIKTY